MYMFHANLKTLKSLAARKKARGLKLEALIKERPCNGMKQNKTKQSCGRPSPRDQNGLISHQILHLKKPQAPNNTWKIKNTQKTNDRNIQVQQQKLPQKHQRELYTQTNTWEAGKTCKEEGSKSLPQKRNWWNESQTLFPSNKSPPRTSLSYTLRPIHQASSKTKENENIEKKNYSPPWASCTQKRKRKEKTKKD